MAYGGDAPYVTTPSLVDNPELKKRIEVDLQEFVDAALIPGVKAKIEIVEGLPWREIREAASSLPADLLVMGTHGRSGFERFMLGSVTERVLHSVNCPVLTVCHEEGRTWEAPGLLSHILCATDLTGASDQTIAFALSLAAENQSKVTFLHVVESVPRPTAGGYPPLLEIGPLTRDLKALATGQLGAAISDDARNWCELKERVEVGRASDWILQIAAEQQADVIVMGSRAHGFGSALFGSTSQHVVRAATCPVLTVRGAKTSGELALVGASAGQSARKTG
jgi:nucleotide-binding universal stress UspA family protein